MGEASGLHMSGPDIQQLFAQAAGVGDDVGVAVVGVFVGLNVGVVVGLNVNKHVSSQVAV